MSTRLPTRLASEPIVEVVSEVRFNASRDAAVNLLPGILHSKFGPFDQQGRTLPMALPPELIQADASLLFRPHVAMFLGNKVIQVGPRVVSVALRAPYPGWTEFSNFVFEVFQVVCNQNFVTEIDWLSLKYTDLISFSGEPPRLGWLNASLTLGDSRLDDQPIAIRAEHMDGPITTVVQVSSPVTSQQADIADSQGLLLEVDTIHRASFTNFEEDYRSVLNDLHERNKRQFFSLLSEDTKSRLGPEYS